ncbi:hypothetical protein AVEN_77181-1, partial [Araneus ventricosus]
MEKNVEEDLPQILVQGEPFYRSEA